MTADPYMDFAERYDWMKLNNPDRDEFFQKLFEKHNVKNVLDCACGTGHELILFDSFGCEVQGSDVSDSMLEQARKNLSDANLEIPLKKIDFRHNLFRMRIRLQDGWQRMLNQVGFKEIEYCAKYDTYYDTDQVVACANCDCGKLEEEDGKSEDG